MIAPNQELISICQSKVPDGPLADRCRKSIASLLSHWCPHLGQEALLRKILEGRDIQFLYVGCGRKWGKSEMGVFLCHLFAYLYPGAELHYLSPTDELTKKLVWVNDRMLTGNDSTRAYNEEVKEIWGTPIKANKAEQTIYWPSGSYVLCDGSRNYDQHRGLKPHLIIADEYRDFHPAWIDAVRPNLGPNLGRLVMLTTPPNIPNHCSDMAEWCKRNEFSDCLYLEEPSERNNAIPHHHEWLAKEKSRLYGCGKGDVYEREYCAKFILDHGGLLFPLLTGDGLVDSAELAADVVDPGCEPQLLITINKNSLSNIGVSCFVYYPNQSILCVIYALLIEHSGKALASLAIDKALSEVEAITGIQDWESAPIVFSNSSRRMAETLIDARPNLNISISECKDIERFKEGVDAINELMYYKKILVGREASELVEENYRTSAVTSQDRIREFTNIQGLKIAVEMFGLASATSPATDNDLDEFETLEKRITKKFQSGLLNTDIIDMWEI